MAPTAIEEVAENLGRALVTRRLRTVGRKLLALEGSGERFDVLALQLRIHEIDRHARLLPPEERAQVTAITDELHAWSARIAEENQEIRITRSYEAHFAFMRACRQSK